MILHVIDVEWSGGTRLRLAFNDGSRKMVDVGPLLKGPMFEPLRNIEDFSVVRLDLHCGSVAWPNGADIAAEALRALPPLDDSVIA